MKEISKSFPEGMEYNFPFDMTTYISQSIHDLSQQHVRHYIA